ncbi:hypothetical protein Tco_1419761 [Tanacetum coccineum]
MFKVDRIEDMVTMHRVQVQLVIGEFKTESGMLIQVKQGGLSATTTTDEQPVQDLALNVHEVFQADDCECILVLMLMSSYATNYVYDHDQYQDAVCEHHEEHEMHDDVQPNYVVDSHANYTSDSNMILYDQYSVFKTTRNTVVDNSLTAELATYKEQVELYERQARFELTEIKQKIDEQLRIVITDCNIKEENLKKELHFVKLQLACTINHNKKW